MSIFSRIKKWLTGDSGKSSSKRASRYSNYGGGGSRSTRSYSSYSPKSSYRQDREDEERRRRQEQKRKQQTTTASLAEISKRTDSLSSGKKPTSTAKPLTKQDFASGQARVVRKIEQKAKATPPDPKKDRRGASAKETTDELKKLAKKVEIDNKSYSKATGGKYDVSKNGIKARQAMKSGEYMNDANAEKWEIENHPTAFSAARGALSGTTFGASDLVAKNSKSRKESGIEDYYQKNKNKYAEMGGELIGSLASFGGTAAATDALGAKVVGKVAPNAAGRLAETQFVKGLAKRGADKAVKKGIASEATDELIKQVGKDRATKIVNALGNEFTQNLTTGAAYDIANATKNHELFSEDWWKELGSSAAFNLLPTSIVAGVSGFGGNKDLVRGAVGKIDARAAFENMSKGRVASGVSDALTPIKLSSKENLRNELGNLARKKAEGSIASAGRTNVNAPRFGNGIDERIALENAETVARRQADDAVATAVEDAQKAVDLNPQGIQDEAVQAVKSELGIPDEMLRQEAARSEIDWNPQNGIDELDSWRAETSLGQYGTIRKQADDQYELFVSGQGTRTLNRAEAEDYINQATKRLREYDEATRITRTTPLNDAENARIAEIDAEIARLEAEGKADADALVANKYKNIEKYWDEQAERGHRVTKLTREKDNIYRKEPPRAEVEPPKAETKPEPRRVGYHAGDTGKAEWYGNQAGSHRGTGHFGTGTYFAGSEDVLKGGYTDRPLWELDFGKYNTYRPKDYEQGVRVHDRLKNLNRESSDIDSAIKKISVGKADAKAMLNDLENAETKEELEAIASRLYSQADMDAISDAAEKRLQGWEEYNAEIARNSASNTPDVLTDDNIDDLLMESIDLNDLGSVERMLRDMESRPPRAEDYIENATYDNAYMAELRDALGKELNDIAEGGTTFDGFVDDLAEDLGVSKEKVENALRRTQEVINGYDRKQSFLKEDSASTIFMKELGYEGVDVTGIEGLDNTEFGSVLYDLRPEDAKKLREGKPRPKANKEPDAPRPEEPKSELPNIKEETSPTEPKTDVLEPYKRNRLEENPDAKFDEANLKNGESASKASAEPKTELPTKAEQPKTELPKTDADTKARTPEEQAKLDEAKKAEKHSREMREERKVWNDEIVNKTNGKYGFREGYSFAAQFADDKEVERLYQNSKRLMENVRNDSASTGDVIDFEGVYKRIGKEERDEIARKAFVQAAENPPKTLEKLQMKLDNGDPLSLNDIMQANALEQICKDAGVEVPAEVQRTLSRVTMESGTQYAQLMASRHLLLKENSEVYRTHLITKDLASFRKRVCNVNEADWAKMAKNLDKTHKADGYLEAEIKRLAKMTGPENADKFEQEYRKLQKEIFRHTEPTVMETLSLIRHTFMLSNLKTGLNNIIGNVSQLSMYRIADFMQVAMENKLANQAKKLGKEYHKKTSLLTNKELRKLASWSSLQNGEVGERISKNAKETEFEKLFNANVKEHISKAMGDSKFGFKAEKGADIVYENRLKNLGMKATRKGSEIVGMMLNEPDSWFVEKSYRLAFAKYLQANGIDTAEKFIKDDALIKEASDYAFDIALENTYKKANRLVNYIEGARTKGYAKGSSLTQKAIAIGLDAELPYVKVPVNLVINNFKYSPMGLVKNAVDAGFALRKGDLEALDRACREMSKGATGTGMAVMGFFLMCDDQAGDDDWGFISQAAEELKEYGVRDNSFKIGDKNLNVANMGIGTVQFLMGARFGEKLNEMGGAPSSFLDSAELVTSAFAANFDAVADMSLLDNAFEIMDAVGNKGDYTMSKAERLGNLGFQIAGNYAGQYLPSPLRGLARGITSADLDTNIKKGDTGSVQRQIDRTKNNLIAGVPYLNEKVLPHKVDRHGNLVNERDSVKAKLRQTLINYADPFSTKTVKIPDADKEEMKVKTESGKPYQPQGYDDKREYKASIGQGTHAEKLDLTGKEREQAARSFKQSGKDSAYNVIAKGFFGDSHGTRADEIMKNIPDDEEKAREYIFNTKEYKSLSNDEKVEFLDAWYNKRLGRGRTANYEVYVNIKDKDEGDFRYQNDLHWKQQDTYVNNNLESAGITKGMWADAIEAAKYTNHRYKDGENKDTIQRTVDTKNALLSLDGWTKEQRIAAFEAIRGKRNWRDWDGVTPGSAWKNYRRGYGGWRHYGHGGGGGKAKVPTPKTIKASSLVKGEALVSKKSSSSASTQIPKLERVKAKIDLPEAKW